MSYRDANTPTRTSFERRCARLASHHERTEARRAVQFAALCEDAKRLVSWGLRNGLLAHPKPKDTDK